MNEILDFFISPYTSASTGQIILEILAVLFGIASVWFAKRENIWVYPSGIVSTVIYVYICYSFTLYGDVLINFYYTIMSIYGWYVWTRTTKGVPLQISHVNRLDLIKALGIFISTAIFVIFVYRYYDRFDRLTDYFDTFTTAVFFAAMWLMANKKIEHWLLWIAGNLISIPLYFMKGLGFTALQFIIFLAIAIFGYLEWKKHLNKSRQPA